MRNYTDLVKRLRSAKDIWQSEEEQWMLEAADAIEELSAYEKIATDEHNRAAKMAWEHRWIPVTERLPEEEETVLVARKFLGIKECPACTYVETAERIGDSWVSDSDEYKIARSKHTDPTHWMPLPEPPKMGGDGQ